MKKRLFIFPFLLTLVSCSSNLPNATTINVVLEKNESFFCTNGYERTINRGESTSFSIEFNHGYKFKSLSHGVFENGIVHVNNVYEPTRIIVFADQIKQCNITVNNDDQKGIVSAYPSMLFEDEELSISAFPNENYEFLGWSLDSSLEDGGAFVSANNTITIQIEDDTNLFTNYINKDEANYIYYFANGGKMLDGSEMAFYKSVFPIFTDRVKNPNTSIGTDFIYRDGYTLYSWNTEPDGSGLDIGLGSRVDYKMYTKLYAKWCKWTDIEEFNFEIVNSDSIAIANCSSQNDLIVVPERINSIEVKRIKASSFSGLPVKEIALPKTIEIIDDNSFKNCTNLESLTFYDNLITASDKAFSNLPKLSTYKINAIIEPRYNKATANAIDFLNNIENHKTIICGGSIVYTSIFADTFLAKSNDYDLGICSGDVAAGFRFYAELACALSKPGDIVAGVPLYWSGAVGGNGAFSIVTFQILESNYDLLQLLDLRHFSDVLDSMCLFNGARLKMNPVGYASVEPYLDARGITVEIKHNPDIDISQLQCNELAFNDDSSDFSFYLRNMCEKKNVEFYIVPGPFINVSFSNEFFDKWFDVYPNALGDIMNFEYPFEFFSNTRWHLTRPGSIKFTDQITKLLKETGCFDR